MLADSPGFFCSAKHGLTDSGGLTGPRPSIKRLQVFRFSFHDRSGRLLCPGFPDNKDALLACPRRTGLSVSTVRVQIFAQQKLSSCAAAVRRGQACGRLGTPGTAGSHWNKPKSDSQNTQINVYVNVSLGYIHRHELKTRRKQRQCPAKHTPSRSWPKSSG